MILRLIGKLFGWDKFPREHFERFMRPHMERAIAVGMPPAVLKELGTKAIMNADYTVTFPGMLLRDYIDEWVDGNQLNG